MEQYTVSLLLSLSFCRCWRVLCSIATVGKAMSSREEVSYPILRQHDVDYVLIVFGGLIGFSGDDINKFLWYDKNCRKRLLYWNVVAGWFVSRKAFGQMKSRKPLSSTEENIESMTVRLQRWRTVLCTRWGEPADFLVSHSSKMAFMDTAIIGESYLDVISLQHWAWHTYKASTTSSKAKV